MSRNCLLMSKQPATIITSLEFQTTPPRRRREPLRNTSGEDSPTLSQDAMTVTWRWNSESSPIRSPAASRVRKRKEKLKESPNTNLYRASIRSNAISSTVSNSASSSKSCSYDNESNSPKGLYKFQEEMKKIALDSYSNSPSVKNTDSNNETEQLNSSMGSLNKEKFSTTPNFVLNDSFKKDLLNDSDFDQVLSTCTENIEKSLSQEMNNKQQKNKNLIETKSNVKLNNSNYMSFFNDESIDDMLGNIEDSVLATSINMNNSKLMRHNSMPQQFKKDRKQTENKFEKKTEEKRNFKKVGHSTFTNRKSLIRHESMPVSASKRM